MAGENLEMLSVFVRSTEDQIMTLSVLYKCSRAKRPRIRDIVTVELLDFLELG